jgi:hypothetical protein
LRDRASWHVYPPQTTVVVLVVHPAGKADLWQSTHLLLLSRRRQVVVHVDAHELTVLGLVPLHQQHLLRLSPAFLQDIRNSCES